jgi:hypothetical protein
MIKFFASLKNVQRKNPNRKGFAVAPALQRNPEAEEGKVGVRPETSLS